MKMKHFDICQVYQSYDDEALKTFANAGLLRRAKKDVAEKVSLLGEDTEENAVTLNSDGQTVTLLATGLQTATCDCPAVGACKHILAAVLWLQTQAKNQSQADATKSAEVSKTSQISEANETPTPDALDEVLSLDLQSLLDSLPKAKRQQVVILAITLQKSQQNRQADEAVNTATEINVTSQRISVRFIEQPDVVTYIAGTGFSGMLSKIEKNTAVWHLLALIEIQRQYGQALANCQGFLATLNHAHPLLADEKSAWQLSEHARSLIADLNSDIAQLLARGLSQVDTYSANRLQLIGLLVRSEHLHRLATQLRQLSGKMLAFLRGELAERDLLIALAKLAAHLYQLSHVTGEALVTLRGSARQRYHSESQRARLTLCPLGARWWQSDTGARGLTLYFYEPDERQIIELTQARGHGKDLSFNAQSAWNQSVWNSTAQQLMTHVNTVENPRFNEASGLASSGSQVSEQIPIDGSADLKDAHYLQSLLPLAISQWAALYQQWQSELIAGELSPCVLLKSHSCGELLIDEIEQCLWWGLQDAEEEALFLRIDSQSHHHIEQIAQLAKPDVQYVIAQVTLHQHRVELSPLSLVLTNEVIHLDFNRRSHPKNVQNALGQLQKYQPAAQQSIFFESLHDNIMTTLDSICSSGRLQLTKNQRQQLQHQAQYAKQAGLTLLSDRLETLITGQTTADNVLKVVFVCDVLFFHNIPNASKSRF